MKEMQAELKPVKLNFVAIEDLRVEGERIDDGCAFLAADFGNGTVCLATIDDPIVLDKDNKEVKEMKVGIGPHFRIIGLVSGTLVKKEGSDLPQLCMWNIPTVTKIDDDLRIVDNKTSRVNAFPNTKIEDETQTENVKTKHPKFFGNW